MIETFDIFLAKHQFSGNDCLDLSDVDGLNLNLCI